MSDKKSRLTAVRLRTLLALALLLLVGLGAGLFWLGHGMLRDVAGDVAEAHAEAQASGSSLDQMRALDERLEGVRSVRPLLGGLRVGGDLPQFEAVDNLQNIAPRHDISIESISFGDSGEGGSTESPDEGGADVSAPSDTVQVTFSVGDDISYQQLLSFLNDIENTTPKLQISSITLPQGSSSGSIDLGQLTLTMYTAG